MMSHREANFGKHDHVSSFCVNMTEHKSSSANPFNFLVLRHLCMRLTKNLLGKSIHYDWSNQTIGNGTLCITDVSFPTFPKEFHFRAAFGDREIPFSQNI